MLLRKLLPQKQKILIYKTQQQQQQNDIIN